MVFKSITKSTYLAEALEALRAAKRVDTVDQLMEIYTINQNSTHSRQTCWNEIRKRYLTIKEGRIIKTPLLKIIDFSGEKLNKELLYHSYLMKEPIAREIVLKYIYPELTVDNSFILDNKNLVLFLKKYIGNFRDTTIKKTAASIRKALVDFGIGREENGDVFVSYYSPSIYSFIYALYSEYSPGYDEAKRFNILNPSLQHITEKAEFYKMFFINPKLLRTYLDSAWEQNYLVYEPRGGLDQYVLKHESLDGIVNYLLKGDKDE